MPIYKGSANQSLVYKGNSVITNVYKGSTLVYRLGFDPVTFTDSGSWVVPTGIKQIRVDCVGCQGYSNSQAAGGKGGRVQCLLNVTPGQVLNITIGTIATNVHLVSYNASDIRIGGTDYSNRVIVAGGGGNCSLNTRDDTYGAGGAGGGLTGGTGGEVTRCYGGSGGTQTAGGAGGVRKDTGAGANGAAGSLALGGAGGYGTQAYGGTGGSGAGGGGYYGGGAGAWYEYFGWNCGGGGGGSSYTNPTLCSEVVHTQGYQDGNGYITITSV